jgi:hypothetical protein
MDVTIHEALDTAGRMLAAIADGSPLPTFSVDPLG